MVLRIPSGWSTPASAQTALSLFVAAFASGCSSQFETETPDLPEGPVPVALQQVASGLAFPLYLTSPAGDPRLFIVEKGGAIRIVQNGALLPTPFLDLSPLVSTGGEQGLLGLAFDPQYASNGRFVVHYTDLAGDTRVSLFRVSQDPGVADPASELAVLGADQPFPNHNGGQVFFGPDGYLYVMLGDGGSAGDPGDRGQFLGDLLGSILRIQPLEAGGYSVPADNPFVGLPDVRPEIWSYGLRNPWRVDIDPATGDLYVADVGEGQWEEVSVSPAAAGAGRGANLGWRIMEGPDCFGTASCDQTGLELPVVWYDHGRGCSITGGFVYRGSAIPALQGHYFYSDYCSGFVRSFRLEDGVAVDQYQWTALAPGANVPGFGRDAAGELYILGTNGIVYRIVPG
ncbi:MAG TPA: PQQ-dependent sugar dehydrogenase [Gemmatimonadales bacterium]|nr:PQQ-dependent sugar dehydrogenase [Gemmatimonadales bacterium]